MDLFIFQDFKGMFRILNYSKYKENYCINATNFSSIHEMFEINFKSTHLPSIISLVWFLVDLQPLA